jgi:H/ACA ribonucleoprotein complex subunit 3
MRIMKCLSCGTYTLQTTCPKCGQKTAHAQPAKYSPEDRYGKYRRMMKQEMGE